MGNFRQHVGFAGFLGVFYAWGASVVMGMHWLYGSVAALLTTMSGLLPDLDSDSSVQLRSFTGLLGILAAVAVWQSIDDSTAVVPFELQVWAALLTFITVRHGLRRALAHLTVHRGMNHSIPAAATWGGVTYLAYPSDSHLLRLVMATAVVLGVLSHLTLDELCSVDLRGRRLNKAFGTALKFFSKSVGATIVAYVLLSLVFWRITTVWPSDPLSGGLPTPRVWLPDQDEPESPLPWIGPLASDKDHDEHK